MEYMETEYNKEFVQELNEKAYKDLFIDYRRLSVEKVLLRHHLCTFPYEKEVDNVVNEFLRNNLQYDLKDLCINVSKNEDCYNSKGVSHILKISIHAPEEGNIRKERIICSKGYFIIRF